MRKIRFICTISILSLASALFAQNMETTVMDGIKLEVYKTYYDNGQLHMEWTQKNDQLHGYHKEFYETGSKKVYKEYKDNALYRIHNEWYPDGTKKKEVSETNGKFQLKEYDAEGNLAGLKDVNEYLYPIGQIKRWYSNGNIKFEGQVKSNNKPTGIYKDYHENGRLSLEVDYSGSETVFLNQIDSSGNFLVKDGFGKHVQYNSDGTINSTYEINNGLRNGKSIMYKGNKIRCEGNYINGRAEGPEYWYYPNGKVEEIIHMKNGVMEKAERNFPMYENPVLVKNVKIKPSERRDENHKKIIPDVFPQLKNIQQVVDQINLDASVYDNRPQDRSIVEVYRVTLNKNGRVENFTRSSGSGYPVSEEIEKVFALMQFDLMGQTKEGIENQIWITFEMYQKEKE